MFFFEFNETFWMPFELAGNVSFVKVKDCMQPNGTSQTVMPQILPSDAILSRIHLPSQRNRSTLPHRP
jgi:hypothetical protein